MPTETAICNLAGGKIGGFGDSDIGTAFIGSINDPNKVASWCKLNFPRVRRRTIKDLATRKAPFVSTRKFLDMGTAVDEDDLPEIGQYKYAFNLPGDYLEMVRQFNENYMSSRSSNGNQVRPTPIEYKYEVIANKRGNGKILLTDTLSNLANDSAFIEYVIDTKNTGGWTEEFIECVATLLASGVCPVAGKDMETSDALLAKYLEVCIPNAMAANQTEFNNTVHSVKRYDGRSGTISIRGSVNLGTYVDAQGNRRSI